MATNIHGNLSGGDTPSLLPSTAPASDPTLTRIGEALRGLRFGTVLAVVQDGVVVQIERTEKTRLDNKTR